MKKLIPINLILVLLLVISGCSNIEKKSANSTKQNNIKSDFVQGVTKDEILVGHLGATIRSCSHIR